MPELPEVEIARRKLDRWAKGRRVLAFEAKRSRVLGTTSPRVIADRLVGATYRDSERRGKNIVARLTHGRDEIGLRIHLGMTGKLLRRTKKEEPPRFTRASVHFSGGVVVHYADMRLFGQLETGPHETLRASAFAGLGPDPFADSLTAELLGERFAKTSAPIKVAMMDQAKIAGVGNIYASESLWRAKISPFRAANSLTAAERGRLAKTIVDVMERTLREEDTPGDIEYVEEPGTENPFDMYAREGEPCPRCRHRIARVVQGGRSTFWCKGCQR